MGSIIIGRPGIWISGGGRTEYVIVPIFFEDLFTTPDAVGFSSPRTSDGNGRLYRSADTNNRVSVADGDLVFAGASNVNYADPAYYGADNGGNAFARAAGLTLLYRVIADNDIVRLGWTNNTTIGNTTQAGLMLSSGNNIGYNRLGTNVNIATWQKNASYLLALTLRANGMEMRVKGGAYSDWSMIFAEDNWNDASLYAAISTLGSPTARLALAKIGRPAALVASDTLSVASPVSGTIYPGVADAVYLPQFTQAASGSGRFLEVRYRQADANNYRFSRQFWDGAQWDYVTGRVVAGVETLDGTAIDNVNSLAAMQVCAIADSHRAFTRSSNTWSSRFAVTDSAGQSNAGVSVVWNGPYTVSSLLGWKCNDATVSSVLDAAVL